MERGEKVLNTLLAINTISQERHLEFKQKLHQVLIEIIRCMEAESGSVMLVKGSRYLEVVASTRPELMGIKQSLDEESPSSWVFRNRVPLRVDDIRDNPIFKNYPDRYRSCAFLLAPITGNNKVIGVISVTDKIGEDLFSATEQQVLLIIAGQVISAIENQRLTQVLKKKSRDLEKKNIDLKRLERLNTELYNILIHDLKGTICETVDNLNLLTYTLHDENLEFVTAALAGCDTLDRMVGNFLDISRLEEKNIDLIYERIDPKDLLKESVVRMSGLARTKDLTLEQNVPDTPAGNMIWADRDMLIRILQNLLSNAIQHSPYGETIETGFRYMDDPPDIEFYVKDNGQGILPQHHKVIFEKFYQLEKETDGRMHTTGLGLTFCKMAVEAHQGKISVTSDGTHGSVFSFVIPFAPKARGPVEK